MPIRIGEEFWLQGTEDYRVSVDLRDDMECKVFLHNRGWGGEGVSEKQKTEAKASEKSSNPIDKQKGVC